jgi:hypothetical protein
MVKQDFDAGDIVIVDGWVLSCTEARLYAMTAQGWSERQPT